MTRGLYLSQKNAEALAEDIAVLTGLVTDITEYEEKNNWYYVSIYDHEGYFLDSVDTAVEALEFIQAYQKEYRNDA